MKNDDKAYLRIKRLNTFIYVASHIFTMVLIFFIALVCKSITALFYLVLIIPTFFKVNSSFNQTELSRQRKKWHFVYIIKFIFVLAIIDFTI